MMNNQEQFVSEPEVFDLKKHLHLIVRNWYIFLITIFIALIAAYYWIQYATPRYQASANILVQDEQNPVQREILELSNLSTGANKVENEMAILRSRSLLDNTLEQLQYDVFYYRKTRFGSREIYREAPFLVDVLKDDHYVVNTKWHLRYISPDKVALKIKAKEARLFSPAINKVVQNLEDIEYTDTVKLGDTISGICGTFRVQPNLYHYSAGKLDHEYAFQFNTKKYLKNTFGQLSLHPKQNASIITVRLSGENPGRLVEFLNTYLQLYLQKGVEKKNRVAQATIDFINEQLEQVSDSLQISENELERFQSENKLLDFDFQSQQIYGNIASLHQEQQNIQLRLEYYEYLQDYITNNETPSDIVAPSSMNIHDPILSSLILQLTELTAERKEMMYNTKKVNPYIANMNRKIEDVKNALQENLESSIQTATIALEQLNRQASQSDSKFTQLPREQRQLLSMKRDFELNNELYNFLLKKRSEMQIAKASNLPSNEIIDEASPDAVLQTAPDNRQIYVLALALAFLLPGGYIFMKNSFNNRITDRDEVAKITSYPVIGQVFHHKFQTQDIFKDHPGSQITDTFRSIRTNFQFFEKKEGANVIQITSSLSKEGKSFISLNLAGAFAVNKKRTVLVDFDLRKARINEYADLNSAKGLSMYLSEHGTVQSHIEKTTNQYLDIIPAGPVPPNPTELAESDKTAELFEYLRQHYHYIFIDTPPIGSISDAYIITRFTDINLFVIRNNFTPKKLFESIIIDIHYRNIPLHLIINDISIQSGQYYGYYRPYKYESRERSFMQKVKNMIARRH